MNSSFDIDALDRSILDIIQTEFPLVQRPYAAIAEQVGCSEEEALTRVNALRKKGVIRQLSANFWAPKLGFVSTLCAAKVPAEALDDFVETVNAIPGVTHNYLRDCEYNVWFTLIAPSPEEAARELARVTDKTGIPVLNLPAEKIFKIKVNFQMQDR